jgi:hypothetical protein
LSYHPVDDGILYLREFEEAAVMTILHVVADVRGEWGVFENGSRRPLSLHPSATEAEFVAWVHADDRGSERIVVHDRYGRTRAAVGAHHESTYSRQAGPSTAKS